MSLGRALCWCLAGCHTAQPSLPVPAEPLCTGISPGEDGRSFTHSRVTSLCLAALKTRRMHGKTFYKMGWGLWCMAGETPGKAGVTQRGFWR